MLNEGGILGIKCLANMYGFLLITTRFVCTYFLKSGVFLNCIRDDDMFFRALAMLIYVKM